MENNFLVYVHSLGISQRKLSTIFEDETNTPKSFFENLSETTLKFYFPNTEQRAKILDTKRRLDTKFIDTVLEKNKVRIIAYTDSDYPQILKNIANPPYILYVRGVIDNTPKLGIIGSRKMTQYGEKTIDTLIPPLSQYFTIVSGGAMGCDTKAHQATLTAGGKTIVVVGTGIDKCYPSANIKMNDEVVNKGGAILSIFPIGETGQAYNFPIRNEIISGLSNGVLLVEAGEKSGTLITAQLALDQGKDLFAIPGDIYKTNSFGCNNLIKKGEAKMVTNLVDILEEYNLSLEQNQENKKRSFSTALEQDIYNLLIIESLSIDEIAKKLQTSSTEIAIALSLLEISGIVKKVQNGAYEVC